jgi:hypothetical protein
LRIGDRARPRHKRQAWSRQGGRNARWTGRSRSSTATSGASAGVDVDLGWGGHERMPVGGQYDVLPKRQPDGK